MYCTSANANKLEVALNRTGVQRLVALLTLQHYTPNYFRSQTFIIEQEAILTLMISVQLRKS